MKKLLLWFVCLNTLAEFNAQSPSFQWAKSMGGSSNDFGNSIVVDVVGNLYTIGFYGGLSDFDPGPGVFNLNSFGGADIFISKLNSSGNLIWAKSIGGINSDYGYSIALDVTGNIYATGSFSGTSDFDPGLGIFNLSSIGGDDIFILKLDNSGNYVWAKSMGGTADETGLSIVVSSSGDIHTIGGFSGSADFDPGAGTFNLSSAGNGDIFISKLSASGNFVWAKKMGGNSWDVASFVAVDATGNVYTTGSFSGITDFDPGIGTYTLIGLGASDIFVSKLNSLGNFVWAKSMGGGASDGGLSIALDLSGNIYTTGSFWGTADFDPGPGVFNLNSFGGADIFISKLNSSGNFVWAKNIGGALDDQGNSIAIDAFGDVYTTGMVSATSDFDPGSGTYSLTGSGLYISKLDATGNFIWAKKTGGNFSNSIELDLAGNVYTTGNFDGTVDFDGGPGIANLTSNGQGDIFILKISQGPVGLKETGFDYSIRIYPNPSDGIINVGMEILNYKNLNFQLTNSLGEVLMEELISINHSTINIQHLPNGIYFIEIKQGEILFRSKIIKN